MSTKHRFSMGTTHIEAERPADRKSLGASLIGQLLEWFEWSSYAVFAPFIAAAFFDKSDPTSALLATSPQHCWPLSVSSPSAFWSARSAA